MTSKALHRFPVNPMLLLRLDQRERGLTRRDRTVESLIGAEWVLDRNEVVLVPESSSEVDTGIDVAGTSHDPKLIVMSAWDRIWAGVAFTGENGPAGWEGWNAGPEFPLPGVAPYSLIGKVGIDGGYFYVGDHKELTYEAGSTARLFLRTNDNVPGNGAWGFWCAVQTFTFQRL